MVVDLQQAVAVMNTHMGALLRHSRCQCRTCASRARGTCAIARKCEAEGACHALGYVYHLKKKVVPHDKCPRICGACPAYKSDFSWRVQQAMQGALGKLHVAMRDTYASIGACVLPGRSLLVKRKKVKLHLVGEAPVPPVPTCIHAEDCGKHDWKGILCKSGVRCAAYPNGTPAMAFTILNPKPFLPNLETWNLE